MTPREAYVQRNARTINQLQEKLQQFTKDLLAHPGHTMEWADSSFKNAATLDLALEIRNALDGGASLENVRNHLQDRVLNHARYIDNHSTSVSSNFMKQCGLAAMVNELEIVTGMVKHEA